MGAGQPAGRSQVPRRPRRHLGDPSFEELIQQLRQSSPDFCKAWKRHEVARAGEGTKTLRHPVAGPLLFEHAVFHPVESPEQRLTLYSPVADSGTAEKLGELLAAEFEVERVPELVAG